MLDFLGGGSALRGIGATAPALRAEIMAALPSLHVDLAYPRYEHGARLLQMENYLSVRVGYAHFNVGPAIVGAGLHSRLECLGLDTCCCSRSYSSYEWHRD